MDWDHRIGRRLKLRDVHVLLAAAEFGSMSKAAAELSISHPVVSKTIADMEHTLGVRLLERSRQGVEPTAYGHAVLRHGLAAFDELRQCVREIESLADPAAGNIRIGSINSLAAGFTAGVIDRLTARHPRVSIQLVAGNIEAMHRDLLDRRIDVLVGWKVGPLADARLGFEVLFDDSHVVVAGKANRWGKRRKITLDELMDEPWVLPAPDSFIGTVIMQAFRAHGLDWPRSTVLTFPHDVRVRLLATGRFLTIFRDSVVRFSAAPSALVPLSVNLGIDDVPMGIAMLAKRARTPAVDLFIRHARELTRPRTAMPRRPA